MNTRKKLALIFGTPLAIALILVWIYQQKVAEDLGPLMKHGLLRVEQPKPNALMQSPSKVQGKARGTWFFEADFPVQLFDEQGRLITTGIATAQEDWMTEDFVPFEAILTFETDAAKGTLVLTKDNPSDLPEHDDEFQIPVRFK